eukprot:scaffold569_cov408-Prasinococcus_capsulatus_cf.AAC.43
MTWLSSSCKCSTRRRPRGALVPRLRNPSWELPRPSLASRGGARTQRRADPRAASVQALLPGPPPPPPLLLLLLLAWSPRASGPIPARTPLRITAGLGCRGGRRRVTCPVVRRPGGGDVGPGGECWDRTAARHGATAVLWRVGLRPAPHRRAIHRLVLAKAGAPSVRALASPHAAPLWREHGALWEQDSCCDPSVWDGTDPTNAAAHASCRCGPTGGREDGGPAHWRTTAAMSARACHDAQRPPLRGTGLRRRGAASCYEHRCWHAFTHKRTPLLKTCQTGSPPAKPMAETGEEVTCMG